MRRIVIWLAGALGVLLIAAICLVVFFDWNWIKDRVAGRLGEAAGREFAIDGDLSVDWSLKPLITAERIRFENADWGSQENMVEIERLAVRVDLLELLRLRVELPELELVKPVILLETMETGEGNWQIGDPTAAAVAEVAVPEERAEFPVIGSLNIQDGRFTYRDSAKGIEITSTISEALAEGGEGDRRFTMEGEGRFAGEPFSLNLVSGSLNRLRDDEQPFPIKFSVAIGATKVSVEGTMVQPLEAQKVDMDLSITGANLADLFPIMNISLPPSPPYGLKGHLTRDGAEWDFTGVRGEIGESDLGGDVKVDMAGEKFKFYATLASRKLRFEDLGPFIGADQSEPPAGATAEPANERVLPDAPIDLVRLRAMDARVVFSGKEILAPGLPIDDLGFTAELSNGRLVLDPIEFGVADGEVAGTIALDGQSATPRMEAGIDIREVRLKPFFKQSPFFDTSSGLVGGRVELRGAGGSIAEMLAAGNGRVVVAMTGGTVSGLAIEAAGLDVGEILGIAVTEDSAVPIRCAVVDLPVSAGVAEVKTLVLDTSDSKITGEGTFNLAEESIDLEVLAHPKDPSLLSARSPLLLSGTFADPTFGVDPAPLVARGAAAAALSVLLTPVAALIPFIELGLGEDSDCNGLIKEAREFEK